MRLQGHPQATGQTRRERDKLKLSAASPPSQDGLTSCTQRNWLQLLSRLPGPPGKKQDLLSS